MTPTDPVVIRPEIGKLEDVEDNRNQRQGTIGENRFLAGHQVNQQSDGKQRKQQIHRAQVLSIG